VALARLRHAGLLVSGATRVRRGARSAGETSVTAQTDTGRELAGVIVQVLNLPHTRADEIVPEAPLLGDGLGLGLDSIDALGIAVAAAQRYGGEPLADDEPALGVFARLRSPAKRIDALHGIARG
jgi:acyl carrier protein